MYGNKRVCCNASKVHDGNINESSIHIRSTESTEEYPSLRSSAISIIVGNDDATPEQLMIVSVVLFNAAASGDSSIF
jgi:hypothetical protein